MSSEDTAAQQQHGNKNDSKKTMIGMLHIFHTFRLKDWWLICL